MKSTIDIKKYYPDESIKLDGDQRLVSEFLQDDIGTNFDDLIGLFTHQYVSNVDKITTLNAKVAALDEQIMQYNDVLRDLASYVGCGGYNSDGLINQVTAKDKIIYGIDLISKVEENRRLAAENKAKQYRNALLEIQRQAENSRIWGGMQWAYQNMHAAKVQKILKVIENAIVQDKDSAQTEINKEI